MQHTSSALESPFDPASLSLGVAWAQEFAWHLQGLGATDNSEILRDLGKRFYPIYQKLDPAAVADSVWAKWPIETVRRTSAKSEDIGSSRV